MENLLTKIYEHFEKWKGLTEKEREDYDLRIIKLMKDEEPGIQINYSIYWNSLKKNYYRRGKDGVEELLGQQRFN